MTIPPKPWSNPLVPAIDAARSTRSPSMLALIQRAASLQRLDSRLRRQLSEPWATRFCVANVRSGTLVLVTGQSTIAARLRLEQSRLLALASRLWPEPVTRLVVKTVPDFSDPSEKPVRPLSQTAARHLTAAAAATDDPELRNLLSRLASLAE